MEHQNLLGGPPATHLPADPAAALLTEGADPAEVAAGLHLDHSKWIFGERVLRDLVDWPPGSFTQGGIGERDNHEMLPLNTVIQAFHCAALDRMGRIAGVLGKTEYAASFRAAYERALAVLNGLGGRQALMLSFEQLFLLFGAAFVLSLPLLLGLRPRKSVSDSETVADGARGVETMAA